jgi:hypothetical protein
MRCILWGIRKRAREKGIFFDLTEDQLPIPDVCPVLGIPILIGAPKNSPYCPSVDRIDPNGPYSAWNCRVISYLANTYKNNMTAATCAKVLKYLRWCEMETAQRKALQNGAVAEHKAPL